MSATIRAALAATMLVGLAAEGAEPGPLQPPVQAPQRQFTLEDIDEGLERLRKMVWAAPPRIQRLVDSRGNSFEKDMSQFVLTDESLARMTAAREKIASEYSPGTPIPWQTYSAMSLQWGAEICRMMVVADQWRMVEAGHHHRELVSVLIQQLPQGERATANASLERAHRQVEASREELLPMLKECDGSEAAIREPPSVDSSALFRDYNDLRAALAEKIDAANQSKGVWAPPIARSTPCPAPAKPAAGSTRAKVVKQGDPFKHFPPSAQYNEVTGSVRVRLSWDAVGCVTSAGVLRSSGSEELDMAAVAVAFETEMIPSEQEAMTNGGAAVLPVTFSIREWPDMPAATAPGQPQP